MGQHDQHNIEAWRMFKIWEIQKISIFWLILFDVKLIGYIGIMVISSCIWNYLLKDHVNIQENFIIIINDYDRNTTDTFYSISKKKIRINANK